MLEVLQISVLCCTKWICSVQQTKWATTTNKRVQTRWRKVQQLITGVLKIDYMGIRTLSSRWRCESQSRIHNFSPPNYKIHQESFPIDVSAISVIHVKVSAFTVTAASSWLPSPSRWWFLPEKDRGSNPRSFPSGVRAVGLKDCSHSAGVEFSPIPTKKLRRMTAELCEKADVEPASC